MILDYISKENIINQKTKWKLILSKCTFPNNPAPLGIPTATPPSPLPSKSPAATE